LSKWATFIATGAPLEYYPYPKEKSFYVGVPTRKLYSPFSKMEQHAARQEWGLATDKPLIVVTGGGLGAKRMNETVEVVLKELMKIGSIVLISGESHYDELRRKLPENSEDFQLYAFVSGIYSLFGAADVV